MSQNTRESVWAISKANIPFYRDGITSGKEEGTKWVQVDGMVDHLCVSISGMVWAIIHDKIHYRSGVTPNNEQGTTWTSVEHDFSLDMLEAGGSCLWVYSRDNKLYVRTGMGFHSNGSNVTRIGGGWVSIDPPTSPSGVTDMALTAQDDLFVLTDDGKLFKRDGCTQGCTEGVNWAKVALPKTGGSGFLGLGAAPSVIHIAGGLEHLWAVTDSNEVWRAASAGHVITERSWERIPGQKMVYVCPSMCDKEITWGINNRDQMYVRTSPQVGRYEWLRQGSIMFRVVTVGVMLNYTIPSEQVKKSISRAASVTAYDIQRNDLKVTDMPFKIEQADQMSEELLSALVIPTLNRQEVLQRYDYDFSTEEAVLSQ